MSEDAEPSSPPWGKDPFSDDDTRLEQPDRATTAHRKRRTQPSLLLVGIVSAAMGAALAVAGILFFAPREQNPPTTTAPTVSQALPVPAPETTQRGIGQEPLVMVTAGAETVGGIAVADGRHFAIPAIHDAVRFEVTTVDGRSCGATLLATDVVSGVTVITCDGLAVAPMTVSMLDSGWLATDASSSTQHPLASTALDQRLSDALGNRIYGLIEFADALPAGTAIVSSDGNVVAMVLADLYRNASATPGADLVPVTAGLPGGMLQRVVDDMTNLGYVSYGDLNVEVIDSVRPGSLDPNGALIWSVINPESPLKKDDLIMSVDNTPILGADDLVSLLRFYRGGDTISITVSRDATEVTMDITLGELAERNP